MNIPAYRYFSIFSETNCNKLNMCYTTFMHNMINITSETYHLYLHVLFLNNKHNFFYVCSCCIVIIINYIYFSFRSKTTVVYLPIFINMLCYCYYFIYKIIVKKCLFAIFFQDYTKHILYKKKIWVQKLIIWIDLLQCRKLSDYFKGFFLII